MRVLAIDTSTEACSVALLIDGEISSRFELTERSHAELVLPMADSLLAEAGVSLEALDGLAFGRGPGAFTGLRIASGVVQGLALGAGLRVAPVSSLAAVAEQVAAGTGAIVLACNDARMGEVYWSVFRKEADGMVMPQCAESLSSPELVAAGWRGIGHAAGNALLRFPALAQRLAADETLLHAGVYPRAEAVARLGARLLLAGGGVDPQDALPIYVRDDVARPSAGTIVTGLS